MKLTPKSWLKSVPCEDTHLNCQPMRRRKRSISASGAREMATKRHVALRQVHVRAVDVVGHERAALAALLPAGREHEVLDQQLAAAVEQVGERAPAVGRVEDVVLVDTHPRQRAALAGDWSLQARQFLLVREQRLARGNPFVPGYDAMVLGVNLEWAAVPVTCVFIALVPSLAIHSFLDRWWCRSRETLSAGRRRGGSDKRGGIAMDSLITAAARALAAGDPLGALKRVALRDDAPALALRGIAMAQLGDFVRAKALLQSAARAFGPKEAVARARCVVAEAEIALVSRDLRWPAKALDAARATLEAHGDRVNAAHARYLEVRRLLLIGRLDEAERKLAELDPAPFPPASRAAHELVVAGIAIRRLRTKTARAALVRAGRAAREAGIPALMAEVESASLVLDTPAARLIARGEERPLLLEEVEALLASKALVVDACRYVVRDAGTVVSLARRPVLFALARALAEAWPADVSRGALLARTFRAKHADESHRARLRVEIGRLRETLRTLADVSATTEALHWCRAAHARSSCWRGPSRRSMRRCSPSSPTASRGRVRRSRLRSAPASAPCSGRSMSLRQEEGAVVRPGASTSLDDAALPGFTTTLLLPAPLPGD